MYGYNTDRGPRLGCTGAVLQELAYSPTFGAAIEHSPVSLTNFYGLDNGDQYRISALSTRHAVIPWA